MTNLNLAILFFTVAIIVIEIIADLIILKYLRNIEVFLISFNKRKVAYHWLYISYQIKDKKETPNYFLKSFFEDEDNYHEHHDLIYWESIFEIYPKNLIACLEKEKIDTRDIEYFNRLTKDRFEKSITYKFNEKIFGEVIGQAKLWALQGDKQQAARLGAIAIKIGLTNPKNPGYNEKQKHWNTVLGLYEDLGETINIKFLFDEPFKTGSLRLTPKSVYKNGLDLLDYFKDNDIIEAYILVQKELNSEIFKEFIRSKN